VNRIAHLTYRDTRRATQNRVLIILSAAFFLASCATLEQRLRAGFEHAGLRPRTAVCMAERWWMNCHCDCMRSAIGDPRRAA
jgi:hypothetical protein